jgi:hypothetical protein
MSYAVFGGIPGTGLAVELLFSGKKEGLRLKYRTFQDIVCIAAALDTWITETLLLDSTSGNIKLGRMTQCTRFLEKERIWNRCAVQVSVPDVLKGVFGAGYRSKPAVTASLIFGKN